MDRKLGPRLEDKLDILDERLDKIESKVDNITSTLVSLDKILDRNTVSLEIHEKRTTASEKRIGYIETHVYLINAVVKVSIAAGGIAAFVLTVLEILKT